MLRIPGRKKSFDIAMVAVLAMIFGVMLIIYTAVIATATIGEGTMFEGIVPTDYIWVDDDGTEMGDGTLSNPYDTISEAVNIADAGTAILVRAGIYREQVKFPSRAGGTEEAPIWLISVDGLLEAKIIAPSGAGYGIQGLGAQNIVIEGFEISGPATRGIQFGMSGSAASDYTLWDNPLTQPTNIVIRGNYIHSTGTDDGIKVSQTNNIQILDNTVIASPNGEDCIDLLAVDDGVISRNECDGSYEAASFSIKGGSRRITFTNNYIHSNIEYPASGIGMGGQGGPGELYRPGTDFDVSDMLVQHNKFEDGPEANYVVNIRGAVDSTITENYFDATGINGSYIVYAWYGTRTAGTIVPALTMWPENLTITDNVYSGTKPFYGDNSSVDMVADNIVVSGNVLDGAWDEPIGPEAFTPTVAASFADTLPFVSLSSSPTAVTSGDSATLTWTSANVTSCTGTNFSTGGAASGSTSVSPTSATTYTISCTGDDGDAETSIVVVVSGGPPDAATDTLIDAMDVEPTTARRTLYNNLIVDIKNAGVWDKLDALYIFAAHDSQAARLNIKNPGTYDLTVGGGSPTFTTDAYYSFNGSTDWFDTNFNPATAGGNYSQNSASLGIWSATGGTRTNAMGYQVNTSEGGTFLSPHTSGDRFQFIINQISISNVGSSGTPWTNSTGLFSANRSGASATQAYWNGSAQSVASNGNQTSIAIPSNSFRIGIIRASGTFGTIDASAAFMGSSLTATEHEDLYTAIDTYLDRIDDPDTSAPSVSLTAPSNNATVSGETVTISATASDDVELVGVQFKLNSTTLLGAEDTTSTYGVTWDSTAVEDGPHTLSAVARDDAGNYATSTITVIVDNSVPMLSNGAPAGAQEAGVTEVVLSLSTDESAECRYATVSDTAFGSMTAFTSTDSTSHSATLSGLSVASYTYYVKCQDPQGITNTSDYSISFSTTAPEPVVAPTPALTNDRSNMIIDGGKIRLDQ